MLTMNPEHFPIRKPQTIMADHNDLALQLPIGPSNARQSSQILEIVDNFMQFGLQQLQNQSFQRATFIQQELTENKENDKQKAEKSQNARRRRAKFSINVSTTLSSVKETQEATAPIKNETKIEETKATVDNRKVGEQDVVFVQHDDELSDSDDEITDASELIPELDLQRGNYCAKKQNAALVGYKRSRREAGQWSPKEHAPKKRVSRNSTKQMLVTKEDGLTFLLGANGDSPIRHPQMRQLNGRIFMNVRNKCLYI